MPPHFVRDLVAWQKKHGRSSLPWQNTREPYKVWLSEIMLQQTQVSTVLNYYPRFLQRFPDVSELANAQLDDVLGLWSGLGYYSRARNLHKCAQEIMSRHAGKFPGTAAQLQALPGIGRSTAAAIAAFCFAERVAILDGNVKRVLTRVLGFSADLAQAPAERALWAKATELLPGRTQMARYTQALMDLGASVCSLRQPNCAACPVQKDCAASLSGEPESYPVKTRKLKRSSQVVWLLCAHKSDGAVWLERRSVPGIWGGLYCLPAFETEEALQQAVSSPVRLRLRASPTILHRLTHKDLHLKPVLGRLLASECLREEHLAPERAGAWFNTQSWPSLGLPAPIRKLLVSQNQVTAATIKVKTRRPARGDASASASAD